MSILVIPNSFVQGTPSDAVLVNNNFNAVAAAVNNINSANIGTLGIYASQIIPTSAAQATFGGTIALGFPAGISIITGNATFSTTGTGIVGRRQIKPFSMTQPPVVGTYRPARHRRSASASGRVLPERITLRSQLRTSPRAPATARSTTAMSTLRLSARSRIPASIQAIWLRNATRKLAY